MSKDKICVHCKKPVIANAENYSVFESMHWLCFHLNFEHSGDPDESCEDSSCPWWHIKVLREKLDSIGVEPSKVIDEAISKRW